MSTLRVSAVQFKWRLEDYKSCSSLKDRIYSILDRIRLEIGDSVPLLVVFPEDIGTPALLFGSYEKIKDKSTFVQAVRTLIVQNLFGVLYYKLKFKVSLIRALMLSKALDMEEDYMDIFSSAASKYNAYIAAGSITLPDFISKNGRKSVSGRDVYNISYFFSPDGKFIGKQKKVHLVDFEGKSGFDLSCGKLDDLRVFDTPFGKIGTAICFDAFFDDVCERLSFLGAHILLQPSANNDKWSLRQQEDWLNGSYKAVYKDRRFKYAVNPMMTGSLFDLAFEGQSSIISCSETGIITNYSLLEHLDGFISISKFHNSEEILTTRIEI